MPDPRTEAKALRKNPGGDLVCSLLLLLQDRI
jgi:hypothetical protein